MPVAPPPIQTTDTEVTPTGTVHVLAPVVVKVASFVFSGAFDGNKFDPASILTAPEPPKFPFSAPLETVSL
jgi:hypothetical protein